MKAIFLDIDGVLQPHGSQKRFDHLAELPSKALELNEKIHSKFDYYAFVGGQTKPLEQPYSKKCDVAAVVWDWHKESVKQLHRVIDETGACIVLSSDWREKGYDIMHALLDIHGFGQYFYGSTFFTASFSYLQDLFDFEFKHQSYLEYSNLLKSMTDQFRNIYPSEGEGWGRRSFDWRTTEIMEYLDRHSEITSYVVVDDLDLGIGLGDHFVHADNILTSQNADQMIAALNRADGPYPLPNSLKTNELETWRQKWVYNSVYYK